MPDRRPNVLFITADQWRGDSLGIAGQTNLRTPNLDRLGREGYYFPRCYSECPVCVAARTVWLTGQHPWTTGSRTNKQVPIDDTTTFPAVFTQAGYRTRGLGKMHFGPPNCWQTHGFEQTVICESGRSPEPDDFHQFLAKTPWAGLSRGHGVGNNDIFAAPSPIPAPYHVNSWTVDITISFLEQHLAAEPETPFLVHTSFSKPHSPYDPPRPYDSLYNPWEVPSPYRVRGDYSEGPPWAEPYAQYYTWDTLGDEQIAVTRCFYWGQITHLDHSLGRLFSALQRLGVADDTAIVFNADHGDLMGDHNFYFKANFYEESTHVPLIVYVPEPLRQRLGLPEPGRCDQLCGVAEVAPTLLALAGLDQPDSMQGDGLLPLLRGERTGAPVDGIFGYGREANLMLREARLKYVYYVHGGFEQLFDTVVDPAELTNLANDPNYASEKARLRQALLERMQSRGADEVLDGGDLACLEYDPEQVRYDAIKGPWGRRPY